MPHRRYFPRPAAGSLVCVAIVAIVVLTGAAGLLAMAGPGAGVSRAAEYKPALLPSTVIVKVPPGRSLSTVHPRGGTTYEFRRGTSYTGTLHVSASHVRITSYGRGRYPVFSRGKRGSDIVLSGYDDLIEHIALTGHGYQRVPRCGRARTAGYEFGINITGRRDTVRSVIVYGNLYAGVYVEANASHARIVGSRFHHVNSLNPNDIGAGAFGILIWGSHNTISRDKFNDQSTCSPVYGKDGSGVEVYRGSGNLIMGCTGQNDADFTELGGAGARGNLYGDDRFAGPGQFLVTRGSKDKADGPVRDTTMINDVAHGAVFSYDWRRGDGTLLKMKDSHVSGLSVGGGYVSLGGNHVGFRPWHHRRAVTSRRSN